MHELTVRVRRAGGVGAIGHLAELWRRARARAQAVLQALTETGSPLGTAILGSVVSSAYLAHVEVAGLPIGATRAVRASIFGGVAVAYRIDSPSLLESVRAAFVHGLDVALLVSAGIALGGALLAVAFLPRAQAPAPIEGIA